MHASAPPATTTLARTARMRCSPSPIAWAEDEQADASAITGPLIPKRMDSSLAGALSIWRGMVVGCTAPRLPWSRRT